MRSGNADLGAGLTQTRAKHTNEAKHLAKFHRQGVQDMGLRILGSLAAVWFAVVGIVWASGEYFAAYCIFGIGMFCMAFFCVWSAMAKNRREKLYDQQMNGFKTKDNVG